LRDLRHRAVARAVTFAEDFVSGFFAEHDKLRVGKPGGKRPDSAGTDQLIAIGADYQDSRGDSLDRPRTP
jgi:hypothetical protein